MTALDRLAERLDALEVEVKSRAAQAGRVTIVDGAIDHVETYATGALDEYGQPVYDTRLVSRMGRQDDGSNGLLVLDGPIPPAPTAPTVTAGPGTLTVRWDGGFAGSVPAPADLEAVTVHLVKSADYGTVTFPSAASIAGALVVRDGDALTVGGLDNVEYTAALVTVTQARKWSSPSNLTKGTPLAAGGDATLALNRADQALALAGGKGKVYRQETAPDSTTTPPPAAGDLWYRPSTQTLSQHDGTAWSTTKLDATQNLKAATVTASLLASQIVLASTIVAGDLNAAHASLTPSGLLLYQPDPGGGAPLVSGRFGSPAAGDFLQVVNNSGLVVASLDQNGGLSAQRTSIGKNAGDTFINGAPFESYLQPLPSGIAWGSRASVGVESTTTTEIKWLEIQTVLKPGRMYWITTWPTYAACNLTAGAAGVMSLRYASGGAPVTTSSYQLQSMRFWMQNNDAWTTPLLVSPFITDSNSPPTEYRFLTTYKAYSPGSATMKLMAGSTYPSYMTVQDMGPISPNLGIEFTAAPPPPQPPTRQAYWSTWKATGSQAYDSTGAKRTDVGQEMITGLDPSGFNGNGTSLAIFGGGAIASSNPGEIGKTLPGALTSEATVTAVEFYLYVHHAYYSQGATLHYRQGTYTSFPETYVNPPSNYYGSSDWAIGQGKYVYSKNEYTTSVTVGQSPVGLNGYARIDGANGWGNPPLMRVTYLR